MREGGGTEERCVCERGRGLMMDMRGGKGSAGQWVVSTVMQGE